MSIKKKNTIKLHFRLGLHIFLSALLCFTLLPINSASAQTASAECDLDFYSSNDILFYNPCETGGTCSASTGSLTAPAPTQLQGSSNAEKVWNYFIQRGLTPIGAAGAMGNIEQESNFDPFIQEGGNGIGFGLIQWSFERRTKLEAAARSAGVSFTRSEANNDPALLFQLNYLWDGEYGEMTWQEPVNAEASVDGDPSVPYSADNTGNGSTLVFHKLVERSGDGTAGKQERIDSAKAFLEQFGMGGSSSGSCAISDGGLTEDQAKKLMMNYGDNRNGDSVTAMNAGPGKPGTGCNGGPLSNCVSFSAFFINKFTDLRYQGGNGNDVVDRLAAAGATTGNEPRLYAVFSNGFGTSAGHTGIILGIQGDTLIVGHASCSHPGSGRGDGTREGGGAGYVITGTIDAGALLYTDQPLFAYPSEVDVQAIQAYINS